MDNSAKTSLKVKKWFEAQDRSSRNVKAQLSSQSSRKISSSFDLRDGEPDWSKTQYFSNTKLYVTPIITNLKSTKKYVGECKYLLTEEDFEGEIIKGEFFYVIVDKLKTDKSFAQNLPDHFSEDFFRLGAIDISFSGYILKYALSYKLIFNDEFKDGKPTDNYAKILTSSEGKLFYIDSPIYPYSKEAGPKCTDWYLVVTNEATGEVTFVTFWGTTCEEYGSNPDIAPPNTVGGSANEPQEACQENSALLSAQANNTHGVLSGNLSNMEEFYADNVTRSRAYEWIALINFGGFGLLSREMGVQNRFMKNGFPDWRWQSLEHVSLTKYGITIGGTMDFSEVATPSVGMYYAGMELLITLKWSIICDVPNLNNIIPDSHEKARIKIHVNATPTNEY